MNKLCPVCNKSCLAIHIYSKGIKGKGLVIHAKNKNGIVTKSCIIPKGGSK